MKPRIVIIGASSGLGLKTAMAFAAKGWTVGMAARRLTPLQTVKNQYPQNVKIAEIDVTADDAPARLSRLIEAMGGMDILLNCAGVGWYNPTLDIGKEMTTVRTNTVGFTAMVDTAFNYFVSQRKPGHIAAITSVAGTRGIGVAAAYSATKQFQNCYLDALDQLSREYNLGISITDIRPGFIRTPLLDADTNYPGIMTVEHVLPMIISAIEKKKRVAYIDFRWKLLVAGWRLIPRWLWRRLKIKLKD
ncbi:MAG: SDR family NAD(P)-dependent oxidoreductase [Muribaculaceae bacterium]|nr:SDR family NAD(P)-dependent oxidoreductase [Muribaculaceae bacterium]